MSCFRQAVSVLLVLACAAPIWAQAKTGQPVADSITRATRNANSKQKYKLAYEMKKGENLRWTVEHVASTKTQIAGDSEETSSRSRSTKLWKVSSVDTQGNMTFVHSVETVKMWQQIGDDEPVTYDSSKDKNAPMEYESVPEKIGKPLAVITISPDGQVMDRKTSLPQARFGVGDITTPLPKESVGIGHKWYVPSTLSAKDEEGRTLQLKTRIHYELSKVKLPNAFISFRTEVLTPVQSEKVRSQIMQQLTKGYVVFDIQRGLPIHKEVEWDEKVQGYEGPDSYLNYVGKLTEKFVAGNRPSKLAPVGQSSDSKAAAKTSSKVNIKPRDGQPIMRK